MIYGADKIAEARPRVDKEYRVDNLKISLGSRSHRYCLWGVDE